jgi:hypothetical protein
MTKTKKRAIRFALFDFVDSLTFILILISSIAFVLMLLGYIPFVPIVF